MSLERNTDGSVLGEAGFIFQTPVRAKKGAAPRPGRKGQGTARRIAAAKRQALARLRGIVARKPEVMLKVSGTTRSQRHIAEHLAYITRNGKLTIENQDGELIADAAERQDLAADWWAGRGQKRPGHPERETVNMVLSMPEGTDPDAVLEAVRAFARGQFAGKHDYVFVLHSPDTDPSQKKAPHPHVHLTVRATGHDGQRLNPNKQDLQAWREAFAAQLRKRGVAAEATPRRARGVVQKGERHVLRCIAREDQAAAPGKRRGRVNRWRVEQAIKTLQAGTPQTGQPWRNASVERQQKIRRSWGALAYALETEGHGPLAAEVRAFVSSMPAPNRMKQDDLVATASADLALLRQTKDALAPSLERQPTTTSPPRRKR